MAAFEWIRDPLFFWAAWLGWAALWIAWTVWRDLGGGAKPHHRR